MNQDSVNVTNKTIFPVLASIPNTNRGVVIIPVTGKPKVSSAPQNEISNPGAASLIVMCCVLAIIMMFCCLAAPGIRDLCKRYVFRQCVIDDPEVNNVSTPQQQPATPTLILLPFGRMLVVDRSMFQTLQSDPAGLDFLELSSHIVRNQSLFTESTPSILDCDSSSKGLTPDSLDFLPPAYDEIFNKDLPPAYSELNLMFPTHNISLSDITSAPYTETNNLRDKNIKSETEMNEM